MTERNDDQSAEPELPSQGRRDFLKRAGFTVAGAAAAAAGSQFLRPAVASAQFPVPEFDDGVRIECPCFGDLINLVTSEGTFPFSGAGNVGVRLNVSPDPNKWGVVVEQHSVTAEDTPFGRITIGMADEIELTPEGLLEFNPMTGGFDQTVFLPITVTLEHCGANGDEVVLRTLPDDPICMVTAEPLADFPPQDAPYKSNKDVGLYAMGADGQVVGDSPIATLPTFDWVVGGG
ncbi:twin-arginine translocation signal domain-containing protein [Haloechinothrix sp. LS1_15]|uniref:twin-arginine translocation signal domain-containing protein n=1 Tax=Haloechinothrix sp. LS1_15 TaxID=2652248 RepID=UPI002946DDFC|nr:twin-arginine translocation signal domain-containing protein [Haloechinothrix sp. LS1_15]MDV6014726.1 twin-arginine translocation signal domain-containing protein [Haloechinothrix sp. LS1_15]